VDPVPPWEKTGISSRCLTLARARAVEPGPRAPVGFAPAEKSGWRNRNLPSPVAGGAPPAARCPAAWVSRTTFSEPALRPPPGRLRPVFDDHGPDAVSNWPRTVLASPLSAPGPLGQSCPRVAPESARNSASGAPARASSSLHARLALAENPGPEAPARAGPRGPPPTHRPARKPDHSAPPLDATRSFPGRRVAVRRRPSSHPANKKKSQPPTCVSFAPRRRWEFHPGPGQDLTASLRAVPHRPRTQPGIAGRSRSAGPARACTRYPR